MLIVCLWVNMTEQTFFLLGTDPEMVVEQREWTNSELLGCYYSLVCSANVSR